MGDVLHASSSATRDPDGQSRHRMAGSLTFLAGRLKSVAADTGATKAELQDTLAKAAFALQVLAEGADHG